MRLNKIIFFFKYFLLCWLEMIKLILKVVNVLFRLQKHSFECYVILKLCSVIFSFGEMSVTKMSLAETSRWKCMSTKLDI